MKADYSAHVVSCPVSTWAACAGHDADGNTWNTWTAKKGECESNAASLRGQWKDTANAGKMTWACDKRSWKCSEVAEGTDDAIAHDSKVCGFLCNAIKNHTVPDPDYGYKCRMPLQWISSGAVTPVGGGQPDSGSYVYEWNCADANGVGAVNITNIPGGGTQETPACTTPLPTHDSPVGTSVPSTGTC